MIGGTDDRLCPFVSEALPCFKRLAGPRYLLHLMGGGHLGLCDVINEGSMPIDRMHALVRRYVTAFFEYHLNGRDSYLRYLGSDAAKEWNSGFNDFEWTVGGR
jgi:hypothetical protein